MEDAHTMAIEVQHLVEDQIYNEFLVGIANDRPIVEDIKDADFIPSVAKQDDGACGESGKEMARHVEEFSSESSDDESGGETTDEVPEAGQEVYPEELDKLKNNVPVAVPKGSLKAAQDRYPPFWRLKHALRNIGENDGYISEEDCDYDPNRSNEEKDQECCHSNVDRESNSSESSDEQSDQDDLESEEKALHDLPDLSHTIKGLVDMVDDLTFVSHETDSDGKEHMEGCDDDFSPVNMVEAILNFDNANYNEADDSDYDPKSQLLDEVETRPDVIELRSQKFDRPSNENMHV